MKKDGDGEISIKLGNENISNSKYPAWILLGAYSLFLICRAWFHHIEANQQITIWEMQNSYKLL